VRWTDGVQPFSKNPLVGNVRGTAVRAAAAPFDCNLGEWVRAVQADGGRCSWVVAFQGSAEPLAAALRADPLSPGPPPSGEQLMMAAPPITAVLQIDESRAVDQIAANLRQIRDGQHTGGLLMGLSGGLDSAVLSTLVVRALGKDALHICYLRERDNETDSERKARLMAEWLGVNLEVDDIAEAIRQRGLYSPLIMRLIGLSRFINRHVIHGAHRLVSGETPFMTTLLQDRFEGKPIKRFFYNQTVRKVEGAFNGRQLYRREVLEQKARQRNALMIGAGNRSEVLTGWFVKDGVDDFPHSPLAGLYKTQVCQLARYLDLPQEIIDQAPSPDMMRGVTDEVALGLDYDRIDLVLDAIERDGPDSELIDAGLTQPQIDMVREMHRRSEWKRNPDHPPPPADGSIRGGLRVN